MAEHHGRQHGVLGGGAVFLWSRANHGRQRLGGDVYIQNGDDSAHVQIAGSGAVSIKGTSLKFNGASINTSGNVTEGTEEAT